MVCKQSLCCDALPTPHCIQRELKSDLGDLWRMIKLA